MRKAQYTVTRKDVQEHTAALLEQKAGLKPTQGKCSLSVLINLVCAAAARLTSLVDACAQMKDAPSGETARLALLATLPDYAKLQQGVNRALIADVPKPLRKRPQRVAIDLHLVPYYGLPTQSGRAVFLHRLGVDLAQRVGLVSLGPSFDATPRPTFVAFGTLAIQSDVAVALACG